MADDGHLGRSGGDLKPTPEIRYDPRSTGHYSVMLAVTMVKKNNQWSFGVGWGPGDGDFFDPDSLSAHKRSCSDER
jgi:hypothetical protein